MSIEDYLARIATALEALAQIAAMPKSAGMSIEATTDAYGVAAVDAVASEPKKRGRPAKAKEEQKEVVVTPPEDEDFFNDGKEESEADKRTKLTELVTPIIKADRELAKKILTKFGAAKFSLIPADNLTEAIALATKYQPKG